jgi:hypothetical protein
MAAAAAAAQAGHTRNERSLLLGRCFFEPRTSAARLLAKAVLLAVLFASFASGQTPIPNTKGIKLSDGALVLGSNLVLVLLSVSQISK